MNHARIAGSLLLSGALILSGTGGVALAYPGLTESNTVESSSSCKPRFTDLRVDWKKNKGNRLEPRWAWRIKNCKGRIARIVTTFSWYANDGRLVNSATNTYVTAKDQANKRLQQRYWIYMNQDGTAWWFNTRKDVRLNIRSCQQNGRGQRIYLQQNTFLMEVTAYDSSGKEVASRFSKRVRCGKNSK